MRNKCIACGRPLLTKPLMICKNMPAVSQNLPREQELFKDRTMDLNLCQCSGCGLVQFDCEPVSYYRDSTRAGERCEALIMLRKKQYKHLIETYNLQEKKILEVGAGKGGFLKTLKEMTEYNIKEYGIENNEEFVKIANEMEHVNVIQGNPESPDTEIDGGPFDAFVSFAYMARLLDPNAMLKFVSNNIVEEGIGLVMVPSLEHLLKPGGFYDITRDHIAYYSKETLALLLQNNGFDILEQGEISQIYIYAIVKKRLPIELKSIWSDVELLAEEVRRFVDENTANGAKVAVWCAGHFAFTILSMTGVGARISYIIDNAEFKKGCYSPGSHVPIVGPEYYQNEPVQTILILGPIYVEEIVDEIHKKCSKSIHIASVDKRGLKEICKF